METKYYLIKYNNEYMNSKANKRTAMTTKNELFEQIKSAKNEYMGQSTYPDYGEVVMSGRIQGKPYDFDHTIGYVVQIRKGRGQFGSDQYLVRHPTGVLATHENQSFWRVDSELSVDALSRFSPQPKDEGGDTEYKVAEGHPETGYIINLTDDAPISRTPAFGITIHKT
jgi:hypothetical protein